MKKDFIQAFIYCYGCSKKYADSVYKSASREYIKEIIKSFKADAGKAFYND